MPQAQRRSVGVVAGIDRALNLDRGAALEDRAEQERGDEEGEGEHDPAVVEVPLVVAVEDEADAEADDRDRAVPPRRRRQRTNYTGTSDLMRNSAARVGRNETMGGSQPTPYRRLGAQIPPPSRFRRR